VGALGGLTGLPAGHVLCGSLDHAFGLRARPRLVAMVADLDVVQRKYDAAAGGPPVGGAFSLKSAHPPCQRRLSVFRGGK